MDAALSANWFDASVVRRQPQRTWPIWLISHAGEQTDVRCQVRSRVRIVNYRRTPREEINRTTLHEHAAAVKPGAWRATEFDALHFDQSSERRAEQAESGLLAL